MKKYISLILALVMSLTLLSGCATQGTIDPADMVKRTDITVGEEWDAVSLDPHVINDEISIRAAAHIYESLVKQDENLEIVPSLAETWENKSDTEIIFHLKKGIKFHNGEEMKAGDVKFSLERAMAQPIVMGSFHAIDSVEAVDDYTVSVKLNQPYAEIMDVLSGVSASIVSE
ncbi:MAG: glutathione ABC transporter substrate-binding protein, partial [Clostridia bacterium]|nr:glutathione ABC transporter substrate-binding protein [Clostridia bacterium]